jgi:hypothetical protein
MREQAKGQAFDPLCRNCRQSRKIAPGTKNIQRTGLCRVCAAAVASVMRQRPSPKRTAHRDRLKAEGRALSPRPWQFAVATRAQKTQRGPTESWWARRDFSTALAEQMSRFKAGGSE